MLESLGCLPPPQQIHFDGCIIPAKLPTLKLSKSEVDNKEDQAHFYWVSI